MRKKLEEKIKIPEGVSCSYENNILRCAKDSIILEKKIHIPTVKVKTSESEISLICEKGNKNDYKKIMTVIAHIKNLFAGLNKNYIYQLEICHVHFPVTLKVEGNKLAIANFFGEKKPRHGMILPNVEVQISGQKITVSSPDKEAAGQTAANFERATKLRNKDRRIFQDGIYIVKKPEVQHE